MKKSIIYTRTGDHGTTSLAGGIRVPKTHVRLEAYGTVDELNAHIGLLASQTTGMSEVETLRFVQHKLFAIGAYLATDSSQRQPSVDSLIRTEHIQLLERAIDETDASLPPLNSFVLPGGTYPAAECHVCRTVCRRAERRILQMEEQEQQDVSPEIKQFINRLSDFLFVFARKLNNLSSEPEIFWDKSCE